MYYSGYKSAAPHYERAIGRAVSTDGISWTKDAGNPVLDKGTSGQWDDFGVQLGNVVKRGTNDYIMFYSGVNAAWTAWGIGVATSTDGISWTKYGSNPVLDYTDFNVGGNSIISFPYAIKASNGTWYMVLSGTHGTDFFGTFAASSSDGLTWTPINSGNRVMAPTAGAWDDDNIEVAQLMETGGKYVMLYNGNDNSVPGIHRMGIASSTDMITWVKSGNNPFFTVGAGGQWDDFRVERMFIVKDDFGTGTIRAWYCGAPSSDGESDSAIGYLTSSQMGI
jgi:predicted GH43/DUF377 family glycosyl hydrolase